MKVFLMKISALIILCVSLLLTGCEVGYKNDGTIVTFHSWNEGSGHNVKNVDADPKSFEAIDDCYGRDKNHAFFRGNIITNSDGRTFRTLKKGFAADKRYVYIGEGEIIPGADPNTFKVHSYALVEDKNDFYWEGKPLKVVDKATFKVLGDNDNWDTKWAKDSKMGYYLPSATSVKLADPESFHPIKAGIAGSGSYSADAKQVYFEDKVVFGADPGSFTEVDYYVGQDKNRVYNEHIPTKVKDYKKLEKVGQMMYSDGYTIYDSDFEILPDADASTFKHIAHIWYRDKKHVWHGTRQLKDVDVESFTPLRIVNSGSDFNYGKDKSHVFFTDSIIEGADVETFEKRDIGGSWCVFDSNRIYSGDSVRWQNYMKTEYKKK